MDLKDYQKGVLTDLHNFLEHVEKREPLNKAFASYWQEKSGIDVHSVSGYLHPYDNSVKGVPNVTVKVPTAGGKTFIACNALKTIFDYYPSGKPRTVAWFVPSDEILRQTARNLKNEEHPYRQRLNTIFNNRVRVIIKDEALMGKGISPTEVSEQVTIFVLSVQSFATNDKEGLRSYRENENLAEYVKFYDSLTKRVDGADETSLMQVLSFLNPVVIVDESHNFEANLRIDVLNAINPFCILNLTATPREKSNIISFVDAIKLKRAHMVKLPVIVYNHHSVNDVIVNAINLQKSLEARARKQEENGGNYIRPIVLFQAQPRANEENITFDKIKNTLLEIGIPEDQIKIKTGDHNEIKDINLLSRDCPVRFIITVDALKEGWDCPFAYILASLANRTSRVSVEQILGRVLRLPYTTKNSDDLLNVSYVFTSSINFADTLNSIISSLNNAGFSRKDFRKKELEPITEQPVEDEPSALNLWGDIDDAAEDNDDGVPEIDSATIKDHMTDDESTDAVADLESFAQAQSDSYSEELEQHEENANDVPNDIQEMVNANGIKDIYPDAKTVVIPRFTKRVESSSIFETEGEQIELDKTVFEEGFDLSVQDKAVNFTLTDVEAVRVDLEQVSKSGEYEVQRRELSSKQLAAIRDQFVGMADENVRNNLARNIARKVRFDSIPERVIIDYIKEATSSLDREKIDELLSKEILVADVFKKKIEGLLAEHRKKKFEEMLDTGEISCSPVYKFPNTSFVSKETLGIYKGLYTQEGDMNGFEERVIRKIAELNNVEFWHRNPDRTGFGINGFINHYPDFIVRLKNGVTVMVETKGDDRDNSDSKNKIALGKAWASKAGDAYRYFMVFDNKEVEGALKLAQLLDRIAAIK